MHRCAHCEYSSNRKYNLVRHMKVHADVQSEAPTDASTSGGNTYSCESCYKTFTRRQRLVEHEEKCRHVHTPLECPVCHVVCADRFRLSKHKRDCHADGSGTSGNTTINNIGTQNIHNTNITNNIQLLVFPTEGEDFDFNTKHITPARLLAMVKNPKPAIGFGKFVGAVLENPVNRFVYKTNPNVNYSKVHTGDGNWEYALDNDVFPEVTHHMTTAALGRLEEDKKTLQAYASTFKAHVQEINEDDDSIAFQEALARMKLILINMCQRFPELAP